MRDGEYGLGIDVGDRTVAAAVCGDDATAAEPLPLPLSRVEDATLRGLVARTGTTTPVYVGDRPVAAADLLAAVVQRVRDAAAVHEGRPDAWTVVVIPPSWSGHRRAALARALERAGVPRFSLLSGAIAATAQHVAAGRLPARPTVAVYDLGASTLDLAVVGPAQDGSGDLDHLAGPPAPEPWGGRDADDAVVTLVRRCLSTPVDAHAAAALRAACVAAKEELSSCTSARLDVPGGSSVRITREELDELLLDRTRQSATAVATAAGAAGLAVGDLDAVVLTGGGVRVPLVAEVLSGELDRPLVVGPDPAMTAALGGARLAAEALRAQAPPDDPEAAPVLLTTGAPPRRHRRSGPPPRPSRRPGRSASVHRLRQSAVVAALFVLLAVAPAALAAVLGGNDTAALPGADVAAAQEAEASGAPTSAGPGGAPDGTGRSGSSGGDGPARTGGGSGRSDAVTSDGPAGVAGDGTTASEPGTTGGSAPSGATGHGATAPGTTAVGTTAVGPPGGGRAASGTPAPGTTASGAAAADTGTGATAPTPPAAAGAGSAGTPAGPSTTTPPDPDPPAEPVVLPDPTPDPTPDPVPEPDPTPDPVPEPDPTPDPVPEPDPEVTPDAAPETTSEAPGAPAETP